jgi:hypothetical protein
MSEYMVCGTEMKELDMVLETLKEMGWNNVEVFDNAVELNGYPRHGTKLASVVIRGGKENNYDIGFNKDASGSFEAYVNDMDRSRPLPRDVLNGRMNKLYSKNVIVRNAKRQGLRVTCEEHGGQIKIRASRR